MRITEIITETAAWQKSSGKNKNGGLNKKGVASYRREHPGSKLQTAVTTKPSKLKKDSKASKRRKSFCARMKGMKKHRTGAETKRDPNSRINKSLRKWHCESIEEMRQLIEYAEQEIAREKMLAEKWSQKYKSSINCSHPKGFSQRAHCAGKKKHNESHEVMEHVCPDCGMCQTHGNLNEIKKGAKDSNGFTKCWPGKHAEGTKKGRNGGQVRNCVPNEGVAEGSLKEFASGNGGSGDYFRELASAWYNGTYNTGSLQKGIKSQQDVERLLQRGVVAPDGKTRKYGIDYNSDFDGVVISSDDYYEHSDYNDKGQEVDSRTGKLWGPYDYMEFKDEELDESVNQGVAEGSDYTPPKLGTVRANIMINADKPTVQVQVFKHNTLRGDSYWVTKEVRTFKTMALAQAYVDRINKQGVAEGITPDVIHKLADRKGVKWDDEPSFLRLTKRLTGKEHLDDLNQDELVKVRDHLKNLDENFADGKNPGRKGLAKRSGVNTKASASSLRDTAKHSTGEKARMAHWLANMKAGKAKQK
jgi:Domain of unknown function (DUF6321)